MSEGAWFRAAIIVGAVPLIAEAYRAIKKKRSSFAISALVIGAVSMWAYRPEIGAAAALLGTLGLILLEILRTQTSYFAARLGFSKVPLVRVIRLDQEKTIPYAAVKTGDRIVVQPGETLPVDGRLWSKTGQVRTNFGTRAVMDLARGEPVTAGDRAASQMVIEAVHVGDKTTAVKVAEILHRLLAETPPRLAGLDFVFLIAQGVWSVGVVLVVFLISRRSLAVDVAVADLLWLGPLAARLITVGIIRTASRAGILIKKWAGLPTLR